MTIPHSIADEAKYYASLGWRAVVLHSIVDGVCTCAKGSECTSPGKHPRQTNWPELATTDAHDIDNLWAKWPESNLGVRLGPSSGICDVEADSETGEAAARLLMGDIRTPTFRSQRSTHRIFRFPNESVLIPKAVVTIDGVEMRFGVGERGSQSVFPPSVHASGIRYEWLNGLSPRDVECQPFPDALIELLSRRSPTKSDGDFVFTMADDYDLLTHPGAPEGERNKTLCSLVGRHLAECWPAPNAFELAEAFGMRCTPPLPAEEVTQTVMSIYQREQAKRARTTPGRSTPANGLFLRPLSDVIAQPTEFAFGKRLAFGRLNVVAGDGDVGKTTVVCDLISRLSRGEVLPGSQEVVSCSSLFVTAEDGEETLRERVEAMGGDLSRILVLGEDEYFDSFRRDIDRLGECLRSRPDIRVVCFDTLPDFVGSDVDDHKNSGVRQSLKQLLRLAAELKVCVIGICHFNKAAGNSNSKLLGSVAYRNLPRSVVYVLKAPNDPESRIVWHEKHNLSAQAPTISFRFQAVADRPPCVEWQVEPVFIDDINSLMHSAQRKSRKLDIAMNWLEERLPPGESVPSAALIDGGKKAGHAQPTLYRAADQLGVIKDRKTGTWLLQSENEPLVI